MRPDCSSSSVQWAGTLWTWVTSGLWRPEVTQVRKVPAHCTEDDERAGRISPLDRDRNARADALARAGVTLHEATAAQKAAYRAQRDKWIRVRRWQAVALAQAQDPPPPRVVARRRGSTTGRGPGGRRLGAPPWAIGDHAHVHPLPAPVGRKAPRLRCADCGFETTVHLRYQLWRRRPCGPGPDRDLVGRTHDLVPYGDGGMACRRCGKVRAAGRLSDLGVCTGHANSGLRHRVLQRLGEIPEDVPAPPQLRGNAAILALGHDLRVIGPDRLGCAVCGRTRQRLGWSKVGLCQGDPARHAGSNLEHLKAGAARAQGCPRWDPPEAQGSPAD